MRLGGLVLFLSLITIAKIAFPSSAVHGISVFGQLKYAKNFTNFDYVNPAAPKGGKVKLAGIGSFDSLNPFILKGLPADYIELVFDSLLQNSYDESSSSYGLIAKSVEVSPKNKWVIFNINKNAHWHDGSELTADDVVFSFDTITKLGHPRYKSYYKEVQNAIKLNKYKVKFNFQNSSNRELPTIVGQLPIISKKFYTDNKFNQAGLTFPLGSGPYKVKSIDAGRSITYERVDNYWAKDLNVNRGRYNFGEIQIDYYLDSTVAVEALKAGQYDFRRENISKVWAKAYNIEQVENGQMVKEELPDGVPTGMQCFVFNTRKANFTNPRVREAIGLAYNFEWTNQNLFYGAYTRNRSFFGNSIFESHGLPSPGEMALLNKFKQILPQQVFNEQYNPPVSDSSGNGRKNLIKARDILREEGWLLRDMQLINPDTNQPVKIEFLLASKSFERVVAPFIKNLNKLGIESTIRIVDVSQYIKRRENFDFDIIVHWFLQGNYPGNEQINYWHSSRKNVKGSYNLAGIDNKAVDFLVEKIVSAKNEKSLQTAAKSLDRALQWNHYVIPQWHSRTHRVIYWSKLARPKTPPYSLGFIDTWWVKESIK